MRAQQPQPGLVELMDYLQQKGLRRALCTRNFECVFSTFFVSGVYVYAAEALNG